MNYFRIFLMERVGHNDFRPVTLYSDAFVTERDARAAMQHNIKMGAFSDHDDGPLYSIVGERDCAFPEYKKLLPVVGVDAFEIAV